MLSLFIFFIVVVLASMYLGSLLRNAGFNIYSSILVTTIIFLGVYVCYKSYTALGWWL